MTQAIDDITLINRALGRIGAGSIASLDEETDQAQQAVSVYFDHVDSLISRLRFSWARRTFRLDKLSHEPETGYRHAFAIPGTALNPTPLRVLTDPRAPERPLRAFVAEAGEIHADHDPLWGQFIVRPPAHVWPAVFREAAIIAVAAALCIPLTHDKDLAAQLTVTAMGTASEGGRGGLLGHAIAIDMAEAGAVNAAMWESDPLTSAWRS